MNREKTPFKGIDICDLSKFGKIFDVSIMVYEILDPLIGTRKCVYRDEGFQTPKLQLLKIDWYEYAYIHDVEGFLQILTAKYAEKYF